MRWYIIYALGVVPTSPPPLFAKKFTEEEDDGKQYGVLFFFQSHHYRCSREIKNLARQRGFIKEIEWLEVLQ
jgi:hypothetical protein